MAAGFMNCVRARLKTVELWEEYVAQMESWPRPAGLLSMHIARTGDRDICFVGLWESEAAIAAARPQMIALLNSQRPMLEELSSDLGLTDPVSGSLVVSD